MCTVYICVDTALMRVCIGEQKEAPLLTQHEIMFINCCILSNSKIRTNYVSIRQPHTPATYVYTEEAEYGT